MITHNSIPISSITAPPGIPASAAFSGPDLVFSNFDDKVAPWLEYQGDIPLYSLFLDIENFSGAYDKIEVLYSTTSTNSSKKLTFANLLYEENAFSAGNYVLSRMYIQNPPSVIVQMKVVLKKCRYLKFFYNNPISANEERSRGSMRIINFDCLVLEVLDLDGMIISDLDTLDVAIRINCPKLKWLRIPEYCAPYIDMENSDFPSNLKIIKS